jgi:hypothetical protein
MSQLFGFSKIYKNNYFGSFSSPRERCFLQIKRSVALAVLWPEPDDLSVTILACRVTILECRMTILACRMKFSLQQKILEQNSGFCG